MIISATLCCTISDEMLGAGDELAISKVALEALDYGRGDSRGDIGVLSRTFNDSSDGRAHV